MNQTVQVKRTATSDPHFLRLVSLLDHELWIELNEDQATYDQHNKVPGIPTAILLYDNGEPAACGCFKVFDEETVEIKRMFVKKESRGKGYSKLVLQALEYWAKESGYQYAILETSIHFTVAQNLYRSNNYYPTPNYPPYVDLPESICMKKDLRSVSF